jgi:hypothetical protein
MSDSATIETAVEHIRNIPEEIRPRTVDGEAGGLLDLTDSGKDVYVLGDLHGMVNNLKASLETDQLEQKLEEDRAVLLLLGDLIHDDRVGNLTNMQPSLETLEYTVELVNRFPTNVFIIRGNHDTFDEQIVKNGIPQAEMFRKYLEEQRGGEYVDAVNEFFSALPLVFLSDAFFAIHAGPVRGGASREHLIEIYRYEQEMFQLMWNRINQIGSVPNKKEYGPADIAKAKELLGYDDDAYFIVGHNPLLDRGGDDSIWFDVMGVKNYIITYDALPESCPILLFRDGEQQHILLYADLKIKKPRFVLGDY